MYTKVMQEAKKGSNEGRTKNVLMKKVMKQQRKEANKTKSIQKGSKEAYRRK